jgi:hypothetical protein
MRGANRDARRRRACAARGVKPTYAARCNPQRSARLPECAHRRACADAGTCRCLRHTARPTTFVGCRREALLVPTVHAGRACAALNRRSAACSTLPPALPSASAIADGGTGGKIAVSCASACARKSASRVLTERAQPHSSALASRRRVPSLLGNGPHRLVLRRRRHLQRRGRDWQRLRRGLRTQHAARW